MKLKKLFISQPMKGKTDDEIVEERMDLLAKAERLSGGHLLEEIDSFFVGAPKNKDNVVTEPVWWLGKSLMKLSEADFAIFGDNWQNFNGCIIEHEVCERYGIQILKD